MQVTAYQSIYNVIFNLYIFFSGQAMDIGAPAILFLIDAWEGHLTPPEAAGIADKVKSMNKSLFVNRLSGLISPLSPGVVGLRRAHGARGGRAGAVRAAARARAQLQRDPARRAAVQGAERRHAGARLPHRGGGRQGCVHGVLFIIKLSIIYMEIGLAY